MRTPFTAESILSMKDRLSSNIGRVVLGETPGGFSGSGGWPFTRDNVCRTLPTTP